jgi:hypothetical protein
MTSPTLWGVSYPTSLRLGFLFFFLPVPIHVSLLGFRVCIEIYAPGLNLLDQGFRDSECCGERRSFLFSMNPSKIWWLSTVQARAMQACFFIFTFPPQELPFLSICIQGSRRLSSAMLCWLCISGNSKPDRRFTHQFASSIPGQRPYRHDSHDSYRQALVRVHQDPHQSEEKAPAANMSRSGQAPLVPYRPYLV